MLRYMNGLSFHTLVQYNPAVLGHGVRTSFIAHFHPLTTRTHSAAIHTTATGAQLRLAREAAPRSKGTGYIIDYASYARQQRDAQSIQLRDQLYSDQTASATPVLRHSMFDEIAEHKIDNSGRTYGSEFQRVEVLVRCGEMDQARQHFHRLLQYADISSWHTYLAGYTRHIDHTHHLMSEWQVFVQHHTPNTISYSILARGLMIQYNASQVYTTIHHAARSKSTTLNLFTLDIIKQMKLSNVSINTYLYNILLQQLFDAHRYRDVLKYYNEMKSANQPLCAPDSYTYNTLFRTLPLLRTACSTDQYIKYWNEMKSYNILPNMVLYRVIMLHLSDNQQYELFYELYYDLIYRKVAPDLQLMRLILNECCRLNRSDDALLAYKYMKQHRIIPTATIYNSIMTIFARRADVNAVLIFWNELCKHNVQPNLAVLSALMQTFTNAGDTERAVEVFTSAPSFNLTPNSYTYSTLFEALKHDTPRLLRYFHEMKERQLGVSEVIYTQVLESCKVSADIDGVLVYMSEMLDNRFTPLLRDYLFVATHLVTQARTCVHQQQPVQPDIIESFQILTELIHRANIYLTGDWYQHYIDFYTLSHNIAALSHTVQTMVHSGVIPTRQQLLSIMQYCMEHDQHVHALEIYYALRSSKTSQQYLTYDFYHLVIECLGTLDLVDELLHILQEMQGNKHHASYLTLHCIQQYCTGTACKTSFLLFQYVKHMQRHIVALQYNHTRGLDTETAVTQLHDNGQTPASRMFQFNFKFDTHIEHMPATSTLPPLYTTAMAHNTTTLANATYRPPGHAHSTLHSISGTDDDSHPIARHSGRRVARKQTHRDAAVKLNRVLPTQHISTQAAAELSALSEHTNQPPGSGAEVDQLYTTFMSSANTHNSVFTANSNDARNNELANMDAHHTTEAGATHLNGFTRTGVPWTLPLRETPCVHYWSVSGCKSLHCKFLHESNANKMSEQQIAYLISKSRRINIEQAIQQSRQPYAI